MNVRIGLSRTEYGLLCNQISAGSPLRRVFEPPQMVQLTSPGPGLPLADEIQIGCSREEADALLKIAEQHCPEIAHRIKEGIRLSGN